MLVRKLYDNQFKVMREFLANFIKLEVPVKYNMPSKLQGLDCSNPEFHLQKAWFLSVAKVKKSALNPENMMISLNLSWKKL